MSDEQTCGKGLAAHAVLPATMSRLAAAMAGVLDSHIASLGGDAASQPEHAAYAMLVQEYRAVAGTLQSIADRMAGYRDLPMATHDVERLQSAEAAGSFDEFVEAEKALLGLLEAMVEQMPGGG